MLRLHFTTADLLRVRFAKEPAPLLELGLALATVQQSRPDPLFARWSRAAAAALTPSARPLLHLVPASGAGPTFIDPPVHDVREGLDLVLSTPSERVAAELERVFAAERRVPPWVSDLARRDRTAWRELALALAAAHAALLGPDWQRIRSSFATDLAWRGRLLQEEGLQTMLTGLLPGSSWQGTTLSLPSARPREVRLDGHGLTLLPSAVWRGGPLHCPHPDGSRLLVYPALTPLPLVGDPEQDDPLAALLGPTRARVLELLTRPRSTTAVARDLAISAASASVHARTLRAAGLVATRRDGKQVLHVCTPLGARLLTAPATAGP